MYVGESTIECVCFCCVFFFQAEDGIRDLVRSRGLGDVYKRQGSNQAKIPFELAAALQSLGSDATYVKIGGNGPNAVSYTHLTLPTSDLV